MRGYITLGVVAVLAVLVWVGPLPLAIGVAGLGLLLAFGWSFLIELPNPGTARKVIVLMAILSPTVAYLFSVRGLVLLGAGLVIAAFVAEMARKDGRPRLLEQLSGTITGGLLTIIAALWVCAQKIDGEPAWLVLGSLAVAIIGELAAPKKEQRPLYGSIGGILGAVGGTLFFDLSWWLTLAAGLLMGLIVAVMDGFLRRLPPATRRRPALAIAAVSVCLGGAIAYVCALIA